MAGFDRIIGNEQIKKYFSDAVSYNKVSHGYILSGESGLGKKTLAKIFAQMLQCEGSGERPCGICHSCKQCQTENHPDIIYVTHKKTVIGVDDIREQVNEDIAVKPYSSPYKIYIINEAEKMSAQAQNALLKTIEEPPEYAIILLLASNPQSLLLTVRSRCVTLNVKPVSDEQLQDYLNQQGVESERIPMLVKFSQGNIGKAIKMAQAEEFSGMIDMLMYLLKNVWKMELTELLSYIEKLAKYKLEIKDCLNLIRLWFRDVLIFKATNDINLLIFKDSYADIYKTVSQNSYEQLEQMIQAIDTAERRLDANVNFEQTMELMLFSFRKDK